MKIIRKIWLPVVAVALLAACGGTVKPTVTVTETQTTIQYRPGPTLTATQIVTQTVTPTANSQGQATTISADGVYVGRN